MLSCSRPREKETRYISASIEEKPRLVKMAEGDSGGEAGLNWMPTWAVTGIYAIIVAASLLMEGALHRAGQVSDV